MYAFIPTSRPLTGADKRKLGRDYRRQKRSHARQLQRHYGLAEGARIARDIHRTDERGRTSRDGDLFEGAVVGVSPAGPRRGNVYLDFTGWKTDPEGRFPVVRF